MARVVSKPWNPSEMRQQLLMRLISSIIAERFPFIGVFSFGKRKMSAEAKSCEYGVVEAWLRFCFWPKTYAQASMCELVQNPWLVFQQFCAFLTNSLAQSWHNFKVVFLIDRMILWHEFMMHHTIAIKENSEQNLHICWNLMCFFWSWLFWTLSLGWLLWPFWTNLDRR